MASIKNVTYNIQPILFGLLWSVNKNYAVCNGYCEFPHEDTLTIHWKYENATAKLAEFRANQ